MSKSIGENIRYYRKLEHMTQKQLGNKLGVSTSYVQQLELSQKDNPSYLIKLNINKILGVEIYDVSNGVVSRTPLREYSTKELLQELLRRENKSE